MNEKRLLRMKIKNKLRVILIFAMVIPIFSITSFASTNYNVKNEILVGYTGKDSEIEIPNNLGIKEIGDLAFNCHTEITKVTIPYGVTTIGTASFCYMSNLTSVSIPSSVTTIGESAFGGAGFSSITIPSGVVTIKKAAFTGCNNLKSVSIPDSVTTIGEYAFAYCKNLTSITILENAKSISANAFEGSKNIKIYGMLGSYAQSFANKNNIPFVQIAASIIATPTRSSVLVNGNSVSFQAYNIDGYNYFKLRDIAKVMSGTGNQFEVGWDGANNAIALTTGRSYTTVGGELTTSGSTANTAATSSTSRVYINGSQVSLTAYNVGGNNYFKLRDVGTAIGFSVDWDSYSSTIKITTTPSANNDITII